MGFRDAWDRAGEVEDDFDPRDGVSYPVRIVDTSAFASRDGREFMKIRLEVADGPDKGRQFDDFHGLSNEIGFRIARESLTMYGLDPAFRPDDIDDLGTGLLELIGNRADVVCKHKDGFLNVTVQRGRVVNGAGASDVPGQESFDTGQPQPVSAGAQDDDDIPF